MTFPTLQYNVVQFEAWPNAFWPAFTEKSQWEDGMQARHKAEVQYSSAECRAHAVGYFLFSEAKHFLLNTIGYFFLIFTAVGSHDSLIKSRTCCVMVS